MGGGDTALEEATFLTRFASKVTMLVPGATSSAQPDHAGPGRARPEDRVHLEPRRRRGEGRDDGQPLTLRDTKTGETSEFESEGLFIAIGYKPNTDLFAGQLRVGEGGYLEVVDETGSGIEGVFVAGDVHDHRYRQAVTAAGDGCKAAIDAERWLASVGEIEASTATNW